MYVKHIPVDVTWVLASSLCGYGCVDMYFPHKAAQLVLLLLSSVIWILCCGVSYLRSTQNH